MDIIPKNWLAFLVLTAVTSTGHAQTSTGPKFSVEQLQNVCISLEPERDGVPSRECSVEEFGLLTTTDLYDFYYALYRDLLETPSRLNLELWDEPYSNKNVLLLFAGERNGDYARLERAWYADRAKLGPSAYQAPEIISTERGRVLHIIRNDTGAGVTQWFNHEYWLWQWGNWQRLDVTSWYKGIDAYLPSGYHVLGLSSNHFDLPNLRSISSVQKPGDANCCPSGGLITIQFKWIDLSLAIYDVSYDPDFDFRSLGQ